MPSSLKSNNYCLFFRKCLALYRVTLQNRYTRSDRIFIQSVIIKIRAGLHIQIHTT